MGDMPSKGTFKQCGISGVRTENPIREAEGSVLEQKAMVDE